MWPFRKREVREAGGEYHDAIVALAEAQAMGNAADVGRTAAVEAASGLLSRALMAAQVDGPEWARMAVNPRILAQIGRDLVRLGESLHVIRMRGGMPALVTCADYHWQAGNASDPDTWLVRATAYGPARSETWLLPQQSVVFIPWGSGSGTTYRGRSPITWASVTARQSAETERSLADESAGPIAKLLPVPQDAGDDDGDENADPFRKMKLAIAAARGKAILLETTAAGLGEGMAAAPRKDWIASRLGPDAPAAQVELARDSFSRVLAATGTPPALCDPGADGTAQREALRRWHLGTVMPIVTHLQWELSRKLDAPIKLKLDGYGKDMVSRAQVAGKLAAIEGVTAEMALTIAGLLEGME